MPVDAVTEGSTSRKAGSKSISSLASQKAGYAHGKATELKVKIEILPGSKVVATHRKGLVGQKFNGASDWYLKICSSFLL